MHSNKSPQDKSDTTFEKWEFLMIGSWLFCYSIIYINESLTSSWGYFLGPDVLCEHMICASEWDTYSSSLRIFHISLKIFLPLGICWLSTLTSVRILMTLQSSNWRLSHYETHETLMRIEYLVLLYEYHINKYVKTVAFLVFNPPDTDFKAKI